MAISGVGVDISGVGLDFQEISPTSQRSRSHRLRVGIERSLGKGLGGSNRMQSWERERETFLPVKIGHLDGEGCGSRGTREAGSKD